MHSSIRGPLIPTWVGSPSARSKRESANSLAGVR
ncbi:Uncharacterised protein [Mycobacteroides abscessus subsp. abscessus]|nr:Uncharacterised protein [Mycobacteroides abscessus subsp. abscessus]